MLQQTRVETVTPYFGRFLSRFPTPLALAEAPMDAVLAAWSGLGYYRRARLLHKGATEVANAREGVIPTNREGLLELPGIGRYTAGAIASIAFGESVGLVDGNVARVLARLFAIEEDMKKKGMRTAETLADALVARYREAGDFNQALMELGATICTPKNPACDRCPVQGSCAAFAARRVHELPLLSKKTKPKEQAMHALVMTDADGKHVLLARRRADGLFGGLWEPPLDSATAKKEAFAKRFGLTAKSLVTKGEVTHILSHRKLSIAVHAVVVPEISPSTGAIPDYETSAAIAIEEVLSSKDRKIGLSTLARKILNVAMVPRGTNNEEESGDHGHRSRRQRSRERRSVRT